MTIEEIIEQEVGYHNEYCFNDIERVALEVRRLTIEECKKNVCIGTGYWKNGLWVEEIDQESFPTDLNNIEI